MKVIPRIKKSGEFLKVLGKDAINELFPTYPFNLLSTTVDSLTKRAIFLVKAKRIAIPIKLTARQIIMDDKYLSNLSPDDRKIVEMRYLEELAQPKAFIEECSLPFVDNQESIFKIILIEERKIICGSAEYFLKKNKEVCLLLNAKDISTLSMSYYENKYFNENMNKKSATFWGLSGE